MLCALCREPASIRHHAAGRANDPDLVCDLCADHAAWADQALRVLGVRLRHDGPRRPAEIAYSRCAGMAALLHLAAGEDRRIVRALRGVAEVTSRALRRYVGPEPSSTGPLQTFAPTGQTAGVLHLMGASPNGDPAEAFERYCAASVLEIGS